MTAVFPDNVAAPSVPLSPGMRAGELLFVSGQVASDSAGTVYRGEFDDEVRMTLDNVERVLAAGGATFDDVVKVGAWLCDAALFGRFNELYAARLGAHRPARTTVVVGFGHPDVRVEIDAVAYLGQRSNQEDRS
ncbi:RidA family protein [Lapillicoccus sp.]|uniref:RidA family protein n=1 Tax=Lapillicoccus sp. TaxID=1909287 RepID=UPI0027D199CC|nr:RidA family protein [Actinomycetota bacterium]